jgi:plasmid stabilization system protein ParE
MALQIEWTLHALEDYSQIVDYLVKEWSLKVAADFINNLEERVQNLSSFPNIGIASVKDPSTVPFSLLNTTNFIIVPGLKRLKYLIFLIRGKTRRKTGMIKFQPCCFQPGTAKYKYTLHSYATPKFINV